VKGNQHLPESDQTQPGVASYLPGYVRGEYNNRHRGMAPQSHALRTMVKQADRVRASAVVKETSH